MIDSSTQYRYYKEEQLELVRLIAMYKRAGLSNEIISKLIHSKGDERALLQYQKKVLVEQAENVKNALAALDVLLGERTTQTYEASVQRIEERLVYCCCGYIANVESIHDFIKSCSAELTRTNPDVRFSEPDYCCVIYPDDGYRETNIFVEYAQSVDRVGVDTELLKFKQIKPITAITVTHRGGYQTLRDAYLFAVNWARENGYVLNGEPRERYIHGVWDSQDESEWVTELQLPILEES